MTATVYSFCHPTCPCQQGGGLLRTPYLVPEGDRRGSDLVQHSIRRWNLSLLARTSFPVVFQQWWAATVMGGPMWKAMHLEPAQDGAIGPEQGETP